MLQKKLTELNDQELLQKQKKLKSNKIMNAALIGLFIGVGIYSTAKNGVGFFSFFPIFFVFLLLNNGKKYYKLDKELQNEINNRNIK